MVQKRQLADEEYDVSPKHLKLEHSCDLVPILQFTKEDTLVQSDKDEGCIFKPVIGVDKGFIRDKSMKEDDYTTTEEDVSSEAPLQTPDYVNLKPRTLIPPEDAYSYLLKRSPLKEIPIGPEYQAIVPEWGGNDADISNHEHENKLMGTCIIPMPEDQIVENKHTIGKGRSDCYCRNSRSLECVQKHIKEARETLKKEIGHERFEKLGFGSMGEVVAEKWTEEEEELFHEVIYSNPATSGKDFWNILEAEFPSRTNQEIVSYYFNVFMLRKRAEQNKFDPMNIDSDDDDECQYGDEIESPVNVRYNDFDQIGSSIFSDSCTSSDTSEVIVDHNKSWAHHDFMLDIGYFSCPITKNDFLPTGSMIEEVFGVESWDFEGIDDDNKSSN